MQEPPPLPTQVNIPKLWGPKRLAWIGFFGSPLVASWLNAQDWYALNRPEEAKKAMTWFWGFMLCYILTVIAGGVMPYILFWAPYYYLSIKPQIAQFESEKIVFDKKSYWYPIQLSVLFVFIYMVAHFFVTYLKMPSVQAVLEAEAPAVVNKIVRQGGAAAALKCERVTIVKLREEGVYEGVASFNNGENLKVIIRDQGKHFSVEIPAQ